MTTNDRTLNDKANPTAFISHANLDNDRFCTEFERELRRLGVDTVFDKHDFDPGESLVRRIYEQGLSRSDAVILVVSRNSITRPWTREELEFAVVRRIEEQTRVIPIIIDELGDDIPEPLRTMVQIRFDSRKQSIADVARQVANLIHGVSLRAEIGPPPSWTKVPLAGLLQAKDPDEYVLASLVNDSLQSSYPYVDLVQGARKMHEDGLTYDDIKTSLAVLEREGYIAQLNYEHGAQLPTSAELTTSGVHRFLRTHSPEQYAKAMRTVVGILINEKSCDLEDLQKNTGLPRCLIEHIGHQLQAEGYARIETFIGGDGFIEAEPTLKRREL